SHSSVNLVSGDFSLRRDIIGRLKSPPRDNCGNLLNRIISSATRAYCIHCRPLFSADPKTRFLKWYGCENVVARGAKDRLLDENRAWTTQRPFDRPWLARGVLPIETLLKLLEWMCQIKLP